MNAWTPKLTSIYMRCQDKYAFQFMNITCISKLDSQGQRDSDDMEQCLQH